MARTLDVYLHNDLAGQLIQDDGGQMVFKYIEEGLNRPDATPLSQSLPLRKERFSRKECRGFFPLAFCRKKTSGRSSPGISASARTMISRCWSRLAVNCAGAVTFYFPPGSPPPGAQLWLSKSLLTRARRDPQRIADASAAGRRRRDSPLARRCAGQNRLAHRRRRNFAPTRGARRARIS